MGGNRQPESGRSIIKRGAVIYGADRQVSEWVQARIDGFDVSPKARALGVMRKDGLVAGVVYENYNGVHIEAAIAADGGRTWASRDTLGKLFSYPFVHLGCRAISVSVPSSNPKSLNLATKLGFEPEAMVKYAAHDGSTLVVLKMFRETCRWLHNPTLPHS